MYAQVAEMSFQLILSHGLKPNPKKINKHNNASQDKPPAAYFRKLKSQLQTLD